MYLKCFASTNATEHDSRSRWIPMTGKDVRGALVKECCAPVWI